MNDNYRKTGQVQGTTDLCCHPRGLLLGEAQLNEVLLDIAGGQVLIESCFEEVSPTTKKKSRIRTLK